MQLPFSITKKKAVWYGVFLFLAILIIYNIFKPKDNSKNIITQNAIVKDLKQTVLATGKVVSETDLSLGFKVSGIVQKVFVKEGQKVSQGQMLASLDQRELLASLTQARGALSLAEANYQKVLDGASSEDIAVYEKALESAKSALENAKIQQDTLVNNAYNALMNSSISAVANPNNSGSGVVSITGTYNGQEQGVYKITIFNDSFVITGLEEFSGKVKSTPVPFGNNGLFISFSGTVYNSDNWTITLPNTLASNYITNYNAYQSALKTRQTTIDEKSSKLASAKVDLDLIKSSARPSEVKAGEAQVLSAQGQVQLALANLENTVIRAPSFGTITKVDIKPGEQATALSEAIIIQDINKLYVEANVSEANIAYVKEGQKISVVFDALGQDRIFEAVVRTVNPASSLVSGVVNYKLVASLEKIEDIRPGMTANLSIVTGERKNVLVIPQRAVISNGKKLVRLINDTKKKTFIEVEVETGLNGDGGLVEVVSGLSMNDEVVVSIKK